jgi:cysteine-rich repeat protein
LTCDTCIVGYEFKTGQCNFKCGNKVREDDEECDDGNNEAEDGCSPTCKLEPGFTCAPLDVTTAGPDVCFCDAKFQSASWTAYWGQIEIVFASNIVYNSANGPKNADAKLFCSQILDPIMLADNKLGTDYSCFLDASATKSTIRINVDLDSTLGNNLMNFTT